MRFDPWLLLAPLAATTAFFVFTWLARSRGRFWTWSNFYLGPTLSTTSGAFLLVRLREQVQQINARCDQDPACSSSLDYLITLLGAIPNLTTLIAWITVFYWQIWLYRQYQDEPRAWVKNFWLAGVSNFLGLAAYYVYWQLLFGRYTR